MNLLCRMLGDVGHAEDIVQEAFTRLVMTAVGKVDDDRGWLPVVTSRLCLDHIRSAKVRREQTRDMSDYEPSAPTLQETGDEPRRTHRPG